MNLAFFPPKLPDVSARRLARRIDDVIQRRALDASVQSASIIRIRAHRRNRRRRFARFRRFRTLSTSSPSVAAAAAAHTISVSVGTWADAHSSAGDAFSFFPLARSGSSIDADAILMNAAGESARRRPGDGRDLFVDAFRFLLLWNLRAAHELRLEIFHHLRPRDRFVLDVLVRLRPTDVRVVLRFGRRALFVVFSFAGPAREPLPPRPPTD